jgi:hypothetical protein
VAGFGFCTSRSGDYHLSVQLDRFTTATVNLTLKVGEQVDVPIELKPAAVNEAGAGRRTGAARRSTPVVCATAARQLWRAEGTGNFTSRGDMSTLATFAISRLLARSMAAAPSVHRRASAKTAGFSKAARTTVPRSRVTARERVHIVWPTLISDGEGRESIGLFYAVTEGAPVAFSPRMQLPTEGLAHHPQIATGPDGTLFIAWDGTVGGVRRAVVAQARSDSDAPRFVRTVVSDQRPAVYPAIATAGPTIVVAWTANRGQSSVISASTLSNESR